MKIINKVVKVGLVLFLSGLVLGIFATVGNKNDNGIFNIASGVKKVEKEDSFKQSIKTVTVDSDISSLRVHSTTKKEISYKFSGSDKLKIDAKVTGDTLEIKQTGSQEMISFGFNLPGSIDLYIPSDIEVSLDADVDAGSFRSDDVKYINLKLAVDVGSLKVYDSAVSGILEVNGNTGSITIENIKEPKNVKIKGDVGSVKLINVYSKDVEIGNDVGSIKYENEDKNYKVDRLNTSSDVGAVKVDVGR